MNEIVQTIQTIVVIIAMSLNLALRKILQVLMMLKDLFWIVVGFVMAVAWEKIKDWRRFKNLIQWMIDELQEIKNSLDFRVAKLPESVKEKVKLAQGGILGVDPLELTALPIDIRMPYSITAWQTFIANGYASKLDDEAYKTLREAYAVLEGMNFLAGLATFQLVGSSPSSRFDEATKTALYQTLLSQPLLTIVSALPKVNAALKKLDEIRTKFRPRRSLIRFFLK